ncbi:MAG: phosphoribosylanthranilate isomerase [Gammaproteobacteria bacterium]
MRTRVKICGITRPQDAAEVAALGGDAIGLVFYPESPRAVSAAQAAEIVAAVPAFVTVVGLFVNATPAQIRAVLKKVRLDLLQFHGDESADACRIYGLPYIKAIAMRKGVDVQACARDYGDAAGLLLDSYHEGSPGGGTGRVFDWSSVPAKLDRPLILAGGLTPENVAEAIRRTRPYAVDVSGGVESTKGIKSAAKIAAFIRGVNSVQP